jgi:hypothetical protein
MGFGKAGNCFWGSKWFVDAAPHEQVRSPEAGRLLASAGQDLSPMHRVGPAIGVEGLGLDTHEKANE